MHFLTFQSQREVFIFSVQNVEFIHGRVSFAERVQKSLE